MARIRAIKPLFFRHRRLFLAEQEAGLPVRLAFAGLWTVADREGRFRWEPDEIKLDCLPYDDVDFAAVLAALERGGFVVRYAVAGREYGFIPSFKQHQTVNQREAASILPEPVPSEGQQDAALASTGAHVHARGEQEQEREGKGTYDAVVSARALDAVRAVWPDLDSRLEYPGLTGSLGMLQAWRRDGADLERDILPTITRVCRGLQSKGRGPPRNFSYFRQAIADTKATNEQGLPHGQPAPARSARQQPPRFKNGFAELVYADLHGAPGDRKPGVVMDMPDPDQPADPGDRRRLAART